MTKQTQRKFTPEFKAKVALEAAKDQLTLAQLSQKFEVNAVTISKWKSEFLANLSATFSNVKETENSEPEVPLEKLYAQIGNLKVELDFLKKVQRNWGYPRANGSRQTETMFTLAAQTMRIAVHSTQFVVLCANTWKAWESDDDVIDGHTLNKPSNRGRSIHGGLATRTRVSSGTKACKKDV